MTTTLKSTVLPQDEEIVRMVQIDQLEETDILDKELEEDAAITCPSTMEFRSALDIVKSYVLFHSEYCHITAIDNLEELLYTRVVNRVLLQIFIDL